MYLEISILVLILAGGWLWTDGMRAREAALEAGRNACEAEGVQFLDWTVAVVRTRVARAGDGRLRVRRVYEFEFSDTGDNRLKGSLALLGTQLITVHLEPREVQRSNVVTLH